VGREKAEELGEVVGLRNGPSTAFGGLPPPDKLGEDLVVAGGQLKRASGERWGKKKQQAFLSELAATGNLRRASAAVGLSYEAVRKRRRRDPHLDAACKAAIEACRARIPEFLAGAAAATFDPEAMPDTETDALPKVTVAEAIRIAQLKGAGPPGDDQPWADENYCYEDDMARIREGLVQKLQAIRRRDRPELLAQGWSYDESWDREIPPGWIKGPDYRPKPPDEPVDFDALYQ
jgi:hypothetical protein